MNTPSIYSIIHRNLKRVLTITLSVSAVILLAYTLFSLRQAEAQAERFITNHVQRLAQAGVSSQNVGAVDPEIAQFVETWKETEDTELRIDVFLNAVHISHAGQLQPFLKLLSNSAEKTMILPSGDTLKVAIQVDLSGVIFYGLILLFIFEGAILILFYLLSRSIQASIKAVTQPLESKVEWLKEIASDLPKSARNQPRFKPSQIKEIDDLGESIQVLTEQIVNLENNLAEANYNRGRLKMAEQVAHSIRGVISTLNVKIGTIPVGSQVERETLKNCITKLTDISGDLLKSKKNPTRGQSITAVPESFHAYQSIYGAFLSKKEQYANLPNVVIEMDGERAVKGYFTEVTLSEMQSLLFNIIDNAVESFPHQTGKIRIELSSTENNIQIAIHDNGQGIPEKIIPSLMSEGFTFGKSEGNGLGLFHAKEIVEKACGEISIQSEEGLGSVVRIKIPIVPPSHSDVKRISISIRSTIICVDDDPMVHDLWDMRLRDANADAGKIVHLFSVPEFEAWFSENGVGNFGERFYLFDFDLKDSKKTGIDVIREYTIGLESILVTGLAGAEAVRAQTKKFGIKQIAKEHAGSIAIQICE